MPLEQGFLERIGNDYEGLIVVYKAMPFKMVQ